MIHHIQIIGEAASKLTPAFRKTHQQVPRPQIIKMRHVLIHDYLGIDLAEVWAVVERDLPTLKKQVSEHPQAGGQAPFKGLSQRFPGVV